VATLTTRLEYKPELCGLRALAVVLVFLHHWTSIGCNVGIIGVQLFFVLSGFLITRILLECRHLLDSGVQTAAFSLRQFYLRRILRIFPLYYLCLSAFAGLNVFQLRETLLWHSFYLSNVLFFIRGEFGGLFSHFWSLAVEEQFYFFWPWVVLLVPARFLPAILAVLISASPLVRAALFIGGRENFAQHSTLLFANFDTLGLGALTAWLSQGSRELIENFQKCLRWLAPICAIEMVSVRIVSFPGLAAWLDPLAVAILSAFMVWHAARGCGGFLASWLKHPIIIYLGSVSYGLYVWHMFAPAFVRNILRVLELPDWMNNGVPGLCFAFSWTVTAASITWFFVERPINSLKSRFPYRKPLIRGDRCVATAIAPY
jgi:peptidoglycan/LPS O-acetylase OafA/YrhL